MQSIVVSLDADQHARRQIDEALGKSARIVYLADLDAASVIFSRNTAKELREDEYAHLWHLKLIQFITAGIDYVPVDRLPASAPVAVNGGGYAEPMAKHALTMIPAACKRPLPEHANLTRREFDQFTPSRMLSGLAAGILGFGGIGIATARVLRPLGVRSRAASACSTGMRRGTWSAKTSAATVSSKIGERSPVSNSRQP